MANKTAYLQRLEALRQLLQDLDAPMDSMAERLRLLGILFEIEQTTTYFKQQIADAEDNIRLNLDNDIDYDVWTNPSTWVNGRWMASSCKDVVNDTLKNAWNSGASTIYDEPTLLSFSNYLPQKIKNTDYNYDVAGTVISEMFKSLSGKFLNTVNIQYIIYQSVSQLCTTLKRLKEMLHRHLSDEQYRQLAQTLYLKYTSANAKENSSQLLKRKNHSHTSNTYEWLNERRCEAVTELYRSAFMKAILHNESVPSSAKVQEIFTLDRVTKKDSRRFYYVLSQLSSFSNDRFTFEEFEHSVGQYIYDWQDSLSPSDQQAFFRFRHLVTLIQSDMDTLSVLPVATNKKSKSTPQINKKYITFSANGINYGHITLLQQYLQDVSWIPRSTPADEFQRLFSGKTCVCKITWIGGGVGNLKFLFQQFINQELISYPKGYNYETILESHFIDGDGHYLTGLNSGKVSNKAVKIVQECISILQTDYNNFEE